MAPTLTSNSFLLTTAPHSRIVLKNPRFALFSKKSGEGPGPLSFPSFRLGNAAGGASSSSEAQEENSGGNGSNPFRFGFRNFVDSKSLIPVGTNTSSKGLPFGFQRRKDPGTVFVAGASGQAGIRISQTLLREGFSVRAGVPDLAAAQELAQLAAKYKIISAEESKRLNAVESTFEDAESIAKAIGNASKVVVTIGPSENGPTAQVTVSDALQVIQAAQLAGVGHLAIVYDDSTSASTYNVWDGFSSFFNNLFSQSQPPTVPELLQKIVEADLSYTLIKAKLTDDFSKESSFNITVSPEGTIANDYKVAKLQIASLVANVFSNTEVAENKVVEVSTDPLAPSRTVSELFSAIPVDRRRKAYAEALAKEKAEEEARKATERAADAAMKLEAEAKRLEKEEARAASLAEEAQEKAAVTANSVETLLDRAKGLSWENFSSQIKSAIQKPPSEESKSQEKATAADVGKATERLLKKAKGIGSGLSWESLSLQIASAVQKPGEESETPLATIRGQAKARTLPAKKALVKEARQKPSAPPKPRPAPKPKENKDADSKAEVRKIFRGLFQQETIYVDD